MSNFRIFPAPGILSVTGSASMIGSGSVNNPTIFSIDGNNGRLLEVTDDLSDSLFSANTIAGLPVIEAFANNCVVLGQFGGHQLRVTCTSIVGGKCNTASGAYSFVGGGCFNAACGNFYSMVGGGMCNVASGCRGSTASGGYRNTASNNYSTVGGGRNNTASREFATIAGGVSNGAISPFATVAGGCSNIAQGPFAFIGGGVTNSASGYWSFVGGGISNCATGCLSFVGGGGGAAFMGCNNRATGDYSSVLGGAGNLACNLNSHIIGAAITTSANNWTYVNNLCQNGGAISDRRTKNTICDTGYRLCDIVKLRPVSFCWNYDASNSKKFGFIAQEVQEAIPDLVNYNDIERVDKDGRRVILGDGDPILQFDREAIYASYVNGFKDLKAENDALKARIEAIEEILERNNLA
jgi:hypothetical protein